MSLLTQPALVTFILYVAVRSALSLSITPADLISHHVMIDEANIFRSFDATSLVMFSILCVSLIYFVIYALLASLRLINQIHSEFEMKVAARLLAAGASSVYLAPMLCAVFFTIEKRAERLTAGSPSMYGYPAKYLGVASVVCVGAFCCQLAFHLCATFVVVASEGWATHTKSVWLRVWSRLYCLSMVLLYGSLAVMFVGVTAMHMPMELVSNGTYVPLSVGTECTLVLAVVYFAVYCWMHYVKAQGIRDSIHGKQTDSMAETSEIVYSSVSCAPMLACLLMGSQIDLDWSGAGPSSDLSKLMYIPTLLVLVQVSLVLLSHLIPADSSPTQFLMPSPSERTCLVQMFMGLHWMLVAALNLSVLVFCWAMRKVSAAPVLTNLLVILAIMYFASSLMLWIATSCRTLRGGGFLKVIKVMTIAKDTLVLCPMLGFLALESFVRARDWGNPSGQAGAPTVQQQYCMYLGAGALGMQLAMTLLSGICACPPEQPRRFEIGRVVYIIFYISTIVFFSSVAIVAWGMISITPESALQVSVDPGP